jgi:ubiquinone/menaquinone biosynthesis C-methylase UbiE
MDFADGSFDLVVSHLLLHEMPVKQIRRMYREIARVLRKGGAMFEGDTVGKRSPDLIDRTMSDWYAHYNNEPFQYQAGELDFAREAREAGLPTQLDHASATSPLAAFLNSKQ